MKATVTGLEANGPIALAASASGIKQNVILMERAGLLELAATDGFKSHVRCYSAKLNQGFSTALDAQGLYGVVRSNRSKKTIWEITYEIGGSHGTISKVGTKSSGRLTQALVEQLPPIKWFDDAVLQTASKWLLRAGIKDLLKAALLSTAETESPYTSTVMLNGSDIVSTNHYRIFRGKAEADTDGSALMTADAVQYLVSVLPDSDIYMYVGAHNIVFRWPNNQVVTRLAWVDMWPPAEQALDTFASIFTISCDADELKESLMFLKAFGNSAVTVENTPEGVLLHTPEGQAELTSAVAEGEYGHITPHTDDILRYITWSDTVVLRAGRSMHKDVILIETGPIMVMGVL